MIPIMHSSVERGMFLAFMFFAFGLTGALTGPRQAHGN
jgi:hypothetical protein